MEDKIFPQTSKLVINFSVGRAWVYFWHHLLRLNGPADI